MDYEFTRKGIEQMKTVSELETQAEARTRIENLRCEAIEQNRRAKLTHGYARKVAYQKKAEALSTLVLMGHAEVNSVEIWGGRPVVGFTLADHKLHAVVCELSADAREIALRQITACLSGTPTKGF
mgnify:CR=1 FL=1